MKIRRATADDAAAIAAIYAPYVTGSVVSFETEAPDAAEMARADRGGAATSIPGSSPARTTGACSAMPMPAAFRAPARLSLHGRDHGLCRRRRAAAAASAPLLYRALLPVLEAQGFTQAIAAITLPNEASVGCTKRSASHQAGTYERVGFKLGEWRSVGLWQRPLAADLSTRPEEPRPVPSVWAG